MKLCIHTDLEGVAGVHSFHQQTYADGRYHDAAKRLLTAEVNAAVEGALAAGATEILVNDSHGPGGMHYESLHHEARILQGGPRPPFPRLAELLREYDTACLIGQHAMEGVADGTLHHTQSSLNVEYYALNGERIGEIAQVALLMGVIGVPLIYLTGDEAACREARETVPGIATTAVKRGLTRTCAISVSMTKAHELIRAGMREAIEQHRRKPVAPLTRRGPYRVEIRFRTSDLAEAKERTGWARVDAKTVARESPELLEVLFG